MKTRIIALVVALVAALALGAGAALAGPQDNGPPASHDRMHTSQQMRAMHAGMPADAQADCDAMHARMPAAMDRMHGQAGMDAMHGGSGMDAMHGGSGMDAMHGQAREG